ncbi:type II toxin-antitoxin system HipA family toxin [Gluconacetobacter aggeris]
MTETALVHEDMVVGRIRHADENFAFAYNPEWLAYKANFPISLSMKLRREPYPHQVIMPWLMNLLPEGDPLAAASRALGIASEDVMGLLERIGQETAGALSVMSLPREPEGPSNRQPDYRKIDPGEELEQIINDLPRKPFLAGEDGVSMSLAGAQEKLPVMVRDMEFFIPINGAPSTHILKPDTERLDGGVYNEALCMTLAKKIGLNVPLVTTGRSGRRSWCLVERYDRIPRPKKGMLWMRLHQEDFCQALGRPPAAKYEVTGRGGGISLTDMFQVTRDQIKGRATLDLLNGVIFNLLITNVDSHAKNYSILLSGSGTPRLAPLYDLIAGDVWPHITQNMAQSIGGQRRGRHVTARHWRRMAETAGLNPRMALEQVNHIAKKIQAHLEDAANTVRSMPAGDHGILDEVVKAIRERVRTALINLDEGAS